MDSFMSEIQTTIDNRLVVLRSATDIQRFSFIVQHSISPLDLAQRERWLPLQIRGPSFYGQSTSSVLDSTVMYPKYLISTEEKCRKVLSRTRDFLYRLHLDLPKTREFSLRPGIEPGNMYRGSISRHIGKIATGSYFYSSLLTSYAKEAVERSDNKLKLIKWFLTFNPGAEEISRNNLDLVFFAKYIYSEVTDPAFVKAFLKKLDLDFWIVRNEDPEILELFLRHYPNGGNYQPDMIDMTISSLRLLNISAILKYQDAPRVLPRRILWNTYNFYYGSPDGDALHEAEKWMSPKRFYFLLQLHYIFSRSPTPPGAECLRLLWSSLPDAFFTLEEIESAFQAALSSETIKEMYNFYSRAVGAIPEHAEPRSLLHLSRPAVRRMLWESGFWIPDGIKLTGVPIELQAFLNLEA